MISTVGQIEKKTQARIVTLFRDRLDYAYLGNRIDRDNRNIEPELLRAWLAKQGVDHSLISRGNGEQEGDEGTKAFIESLQKLPSDFQAKGDIHVFVDECHRTQSGDLHKAMTALLPIPPLLESGNRGWGSSSPTGASSKR